jgi:hypothetical protein
MKLSGLFALLAMLCSGCSTSLTILSGRITAADDQSVTVTLVTKENPRLYFDSYWAYQVFLCYEPEKMSISTTRSDYKPVFREFVFTVPPSSIADDRQENGYTSMWSIPRTDQFNWAFTCYNYVIRPSEEIRMRLGGGTMYGTTLRSNEIRLKMPNQAPEPTSTAVMPDADASVTPSAAVAHL